jgi:hypothetical protein
MWLRIEFKSFSSGVDENFFLVGYDAVSLGDRNVVIFKGR